MALTIKIYWRVIASHQKKYIDLFQQGLKRHGLSCEILREDKYSPSDLAIFWSHRYWYVIQEQRRQGLDYLVMERGYFGDRTRFTSFGFNGLNGNADFVNENSPPDRWGKHGIEVKPWRQSGDYVLLLGQVDGDESIKKVNIRQWYSEKVEELKEAFNLPIYFRPHPLSRTVLSAKGAEISPFDCLESAFENAHCAVLYNSNSGTDAVLHGVPVIAGDQGAISWGVARHHVTSDLIRPDRTQWLNDLAYCQWTEDEIGSGETWEHLKKKYD